MLNRKFADLRHAPDLDPTLLRYDPGTRPQSAVALGPRAREKTKGGVVLARPGFTWAVSFFPGLWYSITSAYDGDGRLVGHHVDLCAPAEERDGMLSFLDLKLDLLILPDGRGVWLDQDEYEQEIAAGTIGAEWQRAVDAAVARLDGEWRAGRFPPPEVAQYRPSRGAAPAQQ
jgi:predicted RNA-binding protein associated with RNAse of E/G family